jgi:hypothetical protein
VLLVLFVVTTHKHTHARTHTANTVGSNRCHQIYQPVDNAVTGGDTSFQNHSVCLFLCSGCLHIVYCPAGSGNDLVYRELQCVPTCVADDKQQNVAQGLPLELSSEELAWLSSAGQSIIDCCHAQKLWLQNAHICGTLFELSFGRVPKGLLCENKHDGQNCLYSVPWIAFVYLGTRIRRIT